MKRRSLRRSAIILGAGASALACALAYGSGAAVGALVRPVTATHTTTAAGHQAAPRTSQTSPCGTLTTAPTYKHVIVIMDENESYKDIIGSSQPPTSTPWPRSAGWPRSTTTSPTTACRTTSASPPA